MLIGERTADSGDEGKRSGSGADQPDGPGSAAPARLARLRLVLPCLRLHAAAGAGAAHELSTLTTSSHSFILVPQPQVLAPSFRRAELCRIVPMVALLAHYAHCLQVSACQASDISLNRLITTSLQALSVSARLERAQIRPIRCKSSHTLNGDYISSSLAPTTGLEGSEHVESQYLSLWIPLVVVLVCG